MEIYDKKVGEQLEKNAKQKFSFTYGALNTQKNVSHLAASLFVKNDQICIPRYVSFNETFGDVYPNIIKTLTITVSESNQVFLIPENRESDFCYKKTLSKQNQHPKYSLIITCYECNGRGCELLSQNLNVALSQTYRPLQIIVSDHSRNDDIEKMVISLYQQRAIENNIEFCFLRFKEDYGNPSANWNFASKYATGNLWQYFAMDDYFLDSKSIEKIVTHANCHENTNWFACAHKLVPTDLKFTPSWNANILTKNTLSGPSAIVVRGELRSVLFDKDFIWFLDLDWYYRLFIANNRTSPGIIDEIIWCNRIHDNQLSSTVCDMNRVTLETMSLFQKYGYPLPST